MQHREPAGLAIGFERVLERVDRPRLVARQRVLDDARDVGERDAAIQERGDGHLVGRIDRRRRGTGASTRSGQFKQ